MSVVRRRVVVDKTMGAAKSSVNMATQTVGTGASRPTIAQMRDAKDALGVDRDTYTPLAEAQSMLPRIRVRPGQAQTEISGVESDVDDFGRPAVLSRAEPPLLGPSSEPVNAPTRGISPFELCPFPL